MAKIKEIMQIYIPNSEINVPIYTPKYIVGDIVYLPNKNNKAGIYLKILSCLVRFSESSMINGNIQRPSIIASEYAGQIMLGSNYDVSAIPIGKALVGYLAMDVLDVDTDAIFVAHKKEDYLLFDRNTAMAIIDAVENDLEKQAIETNGLMQYN